MATINEPTRPSDVILYQDGETVNYTRDQITLASGGGACVLGQVLGQVTIGAVTAAAKSGGNTGNGTCTLLTAGAYARAGVYQLRFTGATTFTITDPRGVLLSNGVNGAYTDAQLNLTITAGGTAFVAGDGFDITVAAGSGKWAQVAPSAVDGTQNAAGICLQKADPSSADVLVPAITRGPMIVKSGGLTWTSGMTTPQKTAALAQLAALGITARTDYGV